MKIYQPGQRVVYEEEGARAVVEIVRRTVEGNFERYQLKVIQPLNSSKVTYIPTEGGDPNVSIRAFRAGDEFEADRNLSFRSGCPGMWTLTDVVNESIKYVN